MPYRVAGIDVHKRMLAVVVADVAVDSEYVFERRLVGTTPDQLRALATWFVASAVEEVVMESTAQYWRPVWDALEREWQPTCRARDDASSRSGILHLAQAQSNHGPRGRKKDFPDAERLVKRLVAHELTLSFVPDVAQRMWRTVTRRKHQLTGNRVQLQSRLECLLEEAHIKVSSFVSDLLGLSARRMLRAVANGETDPATVVALGSPRLHATPDQLRDALGGCVDLPGVFRRLLAMTLDELDLIEAHLRRLNEELAALLQTHQDAVQRLAAVRGWVSIPHSRSSRKSDRRRRPSRRPNTSPRGWAPVRAMRRVRASIIVVDPREGIARCVASSIKPRTPR